MRKSSSRKLFGPILVAVLSLTILLSSSTGTVMGERFEEFDYELIKDGTEVEITGYSGAGGDVVLPSIIEGKSVTSIRYSAFAGKAWLTSVVILEGVTSIGNFAFQNCPYLASIEMPDSIVTIGRGAFGGCTGLTSVTVPANVVSIGIASFSGCTSLSDITLPDGLLQIGSSAFEGCADLTSLVIPESVTRVDNSAFRDCENLFSVTLPDSLTTLGNSVFYGCVNLTSIIIPEGATSIGSQLFQGCTNLSSVVIPETVTMIGIYAFTECENLVSVTLPDDLTTLGSSAFLRCDNLTSMVIPANVGAIGGQAFADCGSLTEIKFMGDAPTVGANWTRNHNPDLIIYHLGSANGFDAEAWVGLNLISLNIPGAPQDVRAVGHRESAVVSWDAPLTDGNSAITGYEVFYNAGEGWVKYGDILSADERSITLTGLEAGISYEFSVKAVNAIGASAMSDVSSAMPFTVPAAPTVMVEERDGELVISWTALGEPHDGWSPVVKYIIFMDGVELDRTSGNSYTVTELTNGVERSIVVKATNAAGEGVGSLVVIGVPQAAPGAPSLVDVMEGDRSVTLQWAAPANNGGVAISAYEIWYGTGDDPEEWARFGTILDGETFKAIVSSLDAGTKYYFGIKAVNTAGASVLSEALSAETWPALVPVSGKVIDAEGNGLAGIVVTLGNATPATTDAEGKFVIMTSRGNHTLAVSGEGIESFTNNITVDGLGLDLAAVEASKAAVDQPGGMNMLIIAAVAAAAVLAGVLRFLLWHRK